MVRYLHQQGDTNGKILNINREILMVYLASTRIYLISILSINREILMVRSYH